MKEKIKALLDLVHDAGYAGISYVGAANYADRELKAKADLAAARDKAMTLLEEILQKEFDASEALD